MPPFLDIRGVDAAYTGLIGPVRRSVALVKENKIYGASFVR